MSTVSVFVPTYNYARYLRECVSSVLVQDDVDVEVLIIDDASTDGSDEVARELASEDPRVAVAVHGSNRGHIATYNEGIAWAQGQYQLLLSADDALVPGALARAVHVMDAHPQVGLVYGDVPRPGEEGRPLRLDGGYTVTPGRTWLEDRCRSGYNVVPTPTAVIRTSLQRRLGGYLPEHPHAGDLEMWLRLSIHGDVAILDCHQGIYRRHDESMSAAWSEDAAIGDLMECKRAFDAVLDANEQVLTDAARLRALAHRASARRMVGRASTVLTQGDPRCALVDELLRLARETDPAVVRSPVYAKFVLRRTARGRLASSVGARRRSVRRSEA